MYIVFDIGGTKMRVAAATNKQTLERTIVLPTPQKYETGLAQLISMARDLAGDAEIEQVAGGIAGTLNADKTGITAGSNLSDWINRDLGQALSDALHCPVQLENDAAVGGLGEATLGAGQGFSRVAYITIGTGLGGAWIINGRLPASGFEPGHHLMNYQSNTNWEPLVDNAPTLHEQIHFLALGLANMLLFWPSDIVILGGGKTIHKGWQTEQISNELNKLHNNLFTVPPVAFTKLGDQAGLYGALQLINN